MEGVVPKTKNFFEFLYEPYAICECKDTIDNLQNEKALKEKCKCVRNPPKKV